jgi:hypothetical protein
MILDFSIRDQVNITMKNPILEKIEEFGMTLKKAASCSRTLFEERELPY